MEILDNHENPREDIGEDDPRLFLPTGCAVLNCALSDRVDGGWPSGRISNLIGDSDTCKTTLGLHALAEACRLSTFDEHSLVYYDIEHAITQGQLAIFGTTLAQRIDKPEHPPETIQEFHYTLLDLFEGSKPFVCILDSLDALPSAEELEHSKETKKAWEKGKESSGSYQMSKQKYLKKMLRELKGSIDSTSSILIIVSQTIDNIGSIFNPKTVAGGNALEFFSRVRFWLSQMETDKVGKRVIGRRVRAKVSKNHITGKKRETSLWVYDRYGVDDIKSCIDFLCEETIFPKMGGWISAFGEKLQIKDMIKHIEANNLTLRLHQTVQETWDGIEASLMPNRSRRYE
jgi:recombination protein RecA